MENELWGLASLCGQGQSRRRRVNAQFRTEGKIREESDGPLAPGIVTQNRWGEQHEDDRACEMGGGLHRAWFQRGAFAVHIAVRRMGLFGMHGAHDSIAAIERP